ncbi:multidrug resistance protein MdtN [Ameyamaea chiangmaiensis NBRC 103196]|uniref:Multidrug transporter subunit MdtN n=1 Tax=Ameyamaea chiangmaiensis TaxID=442969 RepID=A0A850P8H9_9PROT|nr:multidrug transporter subunit MdtN [Ameyamaea chiangmaiensis]MBS4075170.1 multidrug transporter subunit MdtN [Ameyamaea chiangmaiensis]NVN40218.1 multidrug transporter subunit MdtN [Ameyamaea chiangmaiensis]GBQ66300.1 multidrug resistance protein MdtN [Ameyamaea chiangmaiensis NBRC 103196]
MTGSADPPTRRRLPRPGIVIAAVCIALAILVGLHAAHLDRHHPSSDNAMIDAELVHVASTVGGRLIDLPVRVNQHVRRGDLLYRLDPEPYALTVRQTEADLALATAEVENQRRMVAIKTANAASAQAQVTRALTNRDLAARTVDRLGPLAAHAYIPRQEYDQARTSLRDADISLAQARQQALAADIAIGDLDSALAAQAARRVAVEHARYSLRQTQVFAPQDGYVTSLTVRPGEVLAPSQVLFTLVVDDDWTAVADLREGDLAFVQPGACATVFSMIDRTTPMRGHVESIGRGVLSPESAGLARGLPLVPREMDWVHVAQRFPVRVRLDPAAAPLLRMGATATVEIGYGAACR